MDAIDAIAVLNHQSVFDARKSLREIVVKHMQCLGHNFRWEDVYAMTDANLILKYTALDYELREQMELKKRNDRLAAQAMQPAFK